MSFVLFKKAESVPADGATLSPAAKEAYDELVKEYGVVGVGSSSFNPSKPSGKGPEQSASQKSVLNYRKRAGADAKTPVTVKTLTDNSTNTIYVFSAAEKAAVTSASAQPELPGPIAARYTKLLAKYKTLGIGAVTYEERGLTEKVRNEADSLSAKNYHTWAGAAGDRIRPRTVYTINYMPTKTYFSFSAEELPDFIPAREEIVTESEESVAKPSNDGAAMPAPRIRMEEEERAGQASQEAIKSVPLTKAKPGSTPAEIRANNEKALDMVRALEYMGAEAYKKDKELGPIPLAGETPSLDLSTCDPSKITAPGEFRGTLSPADMAAIKRWAGRYSSWAELHRKLDRAYESLAYLTDADMLGNISAIWDERYKKKK